MQSKIRNITNTVTHFIKEIPDMNFQWKIDIVIEEISEQ